jgi:hypothetical protein
MHTQLISAEGKKRVQQNKNKTSAIQYFSRAGNESFEFLSLLLNGFDPLVYFCAVYFIKFMKFNLCVWQRERGSSSYVKCVRTESLAVCVCI